VNHHFLSAIRFADHNAATDSLVHCEGVEDLAKDRRRASTGYPNLGPPTTRSALPGSWLPSVRKSVGMVLKPALQGAVE
jgi:hypothetical protein